MTHVSRITHHVSRITYHASRITHHVSRITYQVSRIKYHLVSHVSCTTSAFSSRDNQCSISPCVVGAKLATDPSFLAGSACWVDDCLRVAGSHPAAHDYAWGCAGT